MKIHPKDFKHWACDDQCIKSVEGWLKECLYSQSVGSQAHFEYESSKEHEFDINCKTEKLQNYTIVFEIYSVLFKLSACLDSLEIDFKKLQYIKNSTDGKLKVNFS